MSDLVKNPIITEIKIIALVYGTVILVWVLYL